MDAQIGDPALERAIILSRGEDRLNRRQVAVGVEDVEAIKAEYRVVKKELDDMLSKERKAQIRFEQVKSQLLRAGKTFAQDLLPFNESPPHQLHLPREIVIVRPGEPQFGTEEETIPVEFDELQAALVRLTVTEEDLDKSSCNERELRIKIRQGEEQLRREGLIPSQGLLSSSAPSTNRDR